MGAFHSTKTRLRSFGNSTCPMERYRGFSYLLLETKAPLEVVPNIPVGPNRNGPFHLISYHNFQSFLLNGKRLRFWRQYTLCISDFIFVVSFSFFFTKYKTTLRKLVLVDTSRVMILLTSRKRLRVKNSKTIDSPVNHRPRRKLFPKK